MNTNSVISAIANSDLSGLENLALKLTPGGVDIANAGDRVIGTLIRGCIPGDAAGVFLKSANGLVWVTLANNTAVAIGDELERADGGLYQQKVTRAITGVSATGVFTSAAHGLPANVAVSLSGLTGGSGLLALPTTYYTLPIDANTFKLSLSPGGDAVALGSDVSAGTLARVETAALAWEPAPAASLGGLIRALLV